MMMELVPKIYDEKIMAAMHPVSLYPRFLKRRPFVSRCPTCRRWIIPEADTISCLDYIRTRVAPCRCLI